MIYIYIYIYIYRFWFNLMSVIFLDKTEWKNVFDFEKCFEIEENKNV